MYIILLLIDLCNYCVIKCKACYVVKRLIPPIPQQFANSSNFVLLIKEKHIIINNDFIVI